MARRVNRLKIVNIRTNKRKNNFRKNFRTCKKEVSRTNYGFQ
jgi:hypothetical protein